MCYKIVTSILQNSHRYNGELMQVARVCLICFIAVTLFGNARPVHPSSPQALPQESSPVFRGNWTATADPTQIFRGTWSAQTSAHSPNAARGSWTLLNQASEIVLQGTWSASKLREGWQGTWTAKTPNGRPFSGTWTAELADFSGNKFQEMLERTVVREVAGSWRTGRQHGNWWLTR
jgi:hypothetical protein